MSELTTLFGSAHKRLGNRCYGTPFVAPCYAITEAWRRGRSNACSHLSRIRASVFAVTAPLACAVMPAQIIA
jgi:hypothetical protein